MTEIEQILLMPGYIIDKKRVLISDDKYKEIYWPELTEYIKDKYFQDTIEIKEPQKVQDILKDCFSFLCNKLSELIENEKRFSFYLFCHNLHEDSIDVFIKQLEGFKLPFNEEKFAASRRILKIILEQSTKYDLNGCPNFSQEMKSNWLEYCELLERMIYVGEWAFISSEYTARSQLFPKAIGISINDNELTFLTHQPFELLFSYIFNEMPNHDSNVALSDCIDDFKELVEEKYNITYDHLCYFIAEIINKPANKLGVTILPTIIENIKENSNVNHMFIESFYKGLTITKENALDIEKCFYNNQDLNRHMYRPILEYNIDKKTFHVIGPNKWKESLSQLSTNCFPFGLFPEEWKANKDLKKFIENVDNTHDKILQDPIIKKLVENSLPHEVDIKSFQTHKKQFININNDIGDIDILFLDSKNKIIYVCECKHNRSRFDYNNWKRDYANFRDKYEKQLKRKVNWATQNIEIIENHFKLRIENPIPNIDLSKFSVEGVFIINAPTLYMFNSKSKCYTIHDFSKIMNNKQVFMDFHFTVEDQNKTYIIKHPYFDNIEKMRE
ncbi:hypothetical protein [Flavobacterium piscis]|uniref:NERD domain-containing protein n=1 Tax=Flavobacterium piscis TaxID=1114874 RepID=A0ABU1Y6R2_9FLAO|nr:hypothetical protein [Flavobacterium piscis]MDR7209918.1 hypothetical protein [Flavobacterium piscis]